MTRHAFFLLLSVGSVGLVAACSDDSTSTPATTGNDAGSQTTSPPSNAPDQQQDAASDAGNNNNNTPTNDGGSGNKAQEDAYCAAVASRGFCNGGTQPSTSPCRDEGKCIYGKLMSAEGAKAYNDCYGSPSCKSDDRCVEQAGATVGGATATQYTADCSAKVDACGGGSKEACGAAVFAYTTIGPAMAACLAKPCADFRTCFSAALKPIADCK